MDLVMSHFFRLVCACDQISSSISCMVQGARKETSANFLSPRAVFSEKTTPSASVSTMLRMKILRIIFKRDALLGSSSLKCPILSLSGVARLAVWFQRINAFSRFPFSTKFLHMARMLFK